MTLAEKIRAIRKAAGISQEEVARRSHLTLAAVSRLERGAATDPHLSTLKGLASALGVSVRMFLEEEEFQPPLAA